MVVRSIVIGIGLFFMAFSQAQVYACKNKQGKTTGWVTSAEECAGDYKISIQAPKPKPKPSAKPAAKSSAGKYKVSPKKQRSIDKARANILFYELDSEKRMIIAIEDALSGDEKPEIVTALKKQKDEHKQNIIAIQQELARLGVDASYSRN